VGQQRRLEEAERQARELGKVGAVCTPCGGFSWSLSRPLLLSSFQFSFPYQQLEEKLKGLESECSVLREDRARLQSEKTALAASVQVCLFFPCSH
jgi:hypothetical protein